MRLKSRNTYTASKHRKSWASTSMLPTMFGPVASLEILIIPLISWTMYIPNPSNSVLEGCLPYLFVPPWLPFSSPRDYTSLSSSIASIIYYIVHHPFTLPSSALSYSLEAAPTHSTCYYPFWNLYFLHSQTVTGTQASQSQFLPITLCAESGVSSADLLQATASSWRT